MSAPHLAQPLDTVGSCRLARCWAGKSTCASASARTFLIQWTRALPRPARRAAGSRHPGTVRTSVGGATTPAWSGRLRPALGQSQGTTVPAPAQNGTRSAPGERRHDRRHHAFGVGGRAGHAHCGLGIVGGRDGEARRSGGLERGHGREGGDPVDACLVHIEVAVGDGRAVIGVVELAHGEVVRAGTKAALKGENLASSRSPQSCDGDGLGIERLAVDGNAGLGVTLKSIFGKRQHQRAGSIPAPARARHPRCPARRCAGQRRSVEPWRAILNTTSSLATSDERGEMGEQLAGDGAGQAGWVMVSVPERGVTPFPGPVQGCPATRRCRRYVQAIRSAAGAARWCHRPSGCARCPRPTAARVHRGRAGTPRECPPVRNVLRRPPPRRAGHPPRGEPQIS